MDRAKPAFGEADWTKPPVATVRVTAALEEALLAGGRYELCPIIQVKPERKIVGFDLVAIPQVSEATTSADQPTEGE